MPAIQSRQGRTMAPGSHGSRCYPPPRSGSGELLVAGQPERPKWQDPLGERSYRRGVHRSARVGEDGTSANGPYVQVSPRAARAARQDQSLYFRR